MAARSFFTQTRLSASQANNALDMIVHKYRNVNPDFVPAEKFVAINKAGEYGCAWMGISGTPKMSVRHGDGLEVYSGLAKYEP